MIRHKMPAAFPSVRMTVYLSFIYTVCCSVINSRYTFALSPHSRSVLAIVLVQRPSLVLARLAYRIILNAVKLILLTIPVCIALGHLFIVYL